MSKRKKNLIFLIVGLLAFSIGCIPLVVPSLKSEDSGLVAISVWCLDTVFLSIWALELHENEHTKKQKGIKNGSIPIVASNCTHISGLAAFVAEGRIQVFTDRVEFSVGGTQYTLPLEQIVSADIVTQKQTEYVTKSNFGRILLSSLLLGDLGTLISIGHYMEEKEVQVMEKRLVITYEKEEKAKSIVLKNLPCKKVIRAIEQNAHLQPQRVDL